jgi:polysaccharide biosynthesis protein PslG
MMIRALLVLAAAACCTATHIPALAEPMLVGVGTHLGFHPSTTDPALFRSWMARARLKTSRDEMFWSYTEDSDGRFELKLGALTTHRTWSSMPAPFEPLLLLDYGLDRYDAGGQPKTEAAVSAFVRYADWMVTQTAPMVRMVEIWNEWNVKLGAKPQGGSAGDPADYVRLAAATTRKIRESRPEIKILVGSVGDDFPDWQWTRKTVQLGVLADADGLSVHMYNSCMGARQVGAEEAIARMDRLRSHLDRAGYAATPVYVTEVGWPTHVGQCRVSEDAAAQHSIRFLLEASLRDWIRGIWFYEFVDGGDSPFDREHRFGLLRRNGTEKPAGCAVRELAAQLAARPKSFQQAGGVTMARFANGATDRWIFWGNAEKESRAATARVSGPPKVLSATRPVAICTLSLGTLATEDGGTSATVKLPPRGILILDVPAAETLTLRAFN